MCCNLVILTDLLIDVPSTLMHCVSAGHLMITQTGDSLANQQETR